MHDLDGAEKAAHLSLSKGRAIRYPINVTCGGYTPWKQPWFLMHGRGLRLPPSVALQADALIFPYSIFWRHLQTAGSQLDTGLVQKAKTESWLLVWKIGEWHGFTRNRICSFAKHHWGFKEQPTCTRDHPCVQKYLVGRGEIREVPRTDKTWSTHYRLESGRYPWADRKQFSFTAHFRVMKNKVLSIRIFRPIKD